MIKFLRWLIGYSEFQIEGNVNLFISNFRNILWNVRKENGSFFAHCLTKNYNYIFKEAKNCECYLILKNHLGFLNILKKYVFRKGLFVGIIVFGLVLFLSNFFVWDVEVRGNVLVPDEKIFRICDKCGLHTGALVFGVNEDEIEFKLKNDFEEISWVSVNRLAGKYVVEIKEGDLKPKEMAETNQPCNVVAAFDGLVLSVKPLGGFVQVQAGDYVKKNQVLVSATNVDEKAENMMLAHGDAEIVAKVDRLNEITLPKTSVRKQKTGIIKTEDRIKLFGLKIPVESKKIGKNVVEQKKYSKPIEFLGFRLPIMCEKTVYDVIGETEVKNNLDQLKRMLLNRQKRWESEKLKGIKILGRNYSFTETDDDLKLSAVVTVCQRIDQKQPVYVKNGELVPVKSKS